MYSFIIQWTTNTEYTDFQLAYYMQNARSTHYKIIVTDYDMSMYSIYNQFTYKTSYTHI